MNLSEGGFNPRKFKGRKAGILGLGLSGRAAAALLLSKGFKVFASDARRKDEVQASLGRLRGRLAWEAGGHSDRLTRCGFVIKSPGIPSSAEVLAKLKAAQIPLFSELEIALAFCKSTEIVAVTGTNGKTTTAALAHAMFAAQRGAKRVHLAGNIGTPLAALAGKVVAKDTILLEVSSYQLEDSSFFSPRAAALLNVTTDHIDHHGSMSSYISAKARLFSGQKEGDACIFNAGDQICTKLARRCLAQKLYFGAPASGVHAWSGGGKLHALLPGAKKEVILPQPRLPGDHNLENAMAAALLALCRGIKSQAISKALKSFSGVEHRLEDFGSMGGLRCVNDSKATNVDSTLVALKSLGPGPRDVFLILGGLHKGSPYSALKPWIERRVKGILTIGAAAAKIEEDLAASAPVFACGNLETAVHTALKIGSKGDTLLLSPACASFDQFKNFEDRGRQFKAFLRAAS